MILLLLLASCATPSSKGTADPTDGYTDTGDAPVEIVPSVNDTGEPGTSCDLAEVDPYDWTRVITYDVEVDQEDIDYLTSLGYVWGETYSQLPPITGTVTITIDGCEPILFEDVRLEICREMGYIAPPGETSWCMEYNEEHDDQTIGVYDDGRHWSPLYAGPVAEMYLYRFSTTYLSVHGRRMAWEEFGANYWPSDFHAVYDSFEPQREDMMDRDYGSDGWVSLFDGDPAAGTCQVGECDTLRLNTCYETLANISDSDALIEETSECFDWTNIAATYAWEIYYSHWDGCMSPHNCLTEELGDPVSPDTTWFGLRLSGIDLVNPNWVYVTDVSFASWNSLYYACWMDQSEGGCRDMMADDVRLLIAVGRDGTMNADLDTVAAQRQALNLWWDGEDDDWYAAQGDWLAARPDYVEAALELALDPCNDWASGWYYYGWDTGSGAIEGCGTDTGAVDTGPHDTGAVGDTGDTSVVIIDTADTAL